LNRKELFICGLVGIAGKLGINDENILKRLLIYDTFRGLDSTGLAAVRKTGEVSMAKVASHPIDLFDTGKFKTALSAWNSYAFLGHNRFATTGAKNSVNAHPFQFGHIVGAHNGTLDKESWKRLETAIGEETDVDSAAVFMSFEKIGVEETLALLENGRTSNAGAWAFTWVDLKDGTLNFLRNEHRPLWYSYSEGHDRIFWASEWGMIRAAVSMAPGDQKLFIDKEYHSYWQIEKDVWYKIPLEDLAKGSADVVDYRHKELKGREPAPVKVTPPFTMGAGNGYGMNTTTTKTTLSGSASKTPVDVITIKTGKADPFAGHLKEEAFRGIARYGCSWCKEEVKYDVPGVTVFMNDDTLLGPCCSGNGKRNRVIVSSIDMNDIEDLMVLNG